MAKQNIFPIQQTHTYSSGATTRVDLPLSGYITHLDLLLTVTVTTSGSTILEDPYGQLIRSLRIKAAGAKTFLDVSDGRQLWYKAYNEYRGQLRADTIASSATSTYYALLPIHFGVNPYDLFDPTCVIPAVELQDLSMELTWGTTSSIGASGTGVSALSATAQIISHEIALDPGESRNSIWTDGIISPRWEPKIISLGATYSNLGLTSDLPVGDTLNKVLVMVLTSGDARTNTNVTSVGFKLPKRRETPLERLWLTQVANNRIMNDLGTDVAGVAVIRGSEISGRPLGLDLTRAVTGDAQIAFTVGTGSGAIHLLHLMYS